MAINKTLFFGTVILGLSVAMAAIMMCLEGWKGNCDPTESASVTNPCLHVGLRTYTIDYGSSTTSGSLSKSTAADEYNGGTIILATGIIGMFVFICSMVLMCVAHSKGESKFRVISLIGLYCSVGLLILGIVLYAYKQDAGYSFIIMTIAGFCYFVGVGLIVGGGWSIEDAPNEAKPVPDSH